MGYMMQKAIEALFDSVNDHTKINREEFSENLRKWIRCGHKLDDLCKEFGTGCLAFLGASLTESL